MRNLIPRSKLSVSAAIVFLVFCSVAASGESLRYGVVLREIVESRLARYGGDNKEREATLKQMFAEAGCDDQHLSEQLVKGSKLPNVICTLPGSADRVIIV